MADPKVVIVLSGKRKSGKDFIARKILNLFGEENCHTVHLSSPLKLEYAKIHNLDYKELMTSGSYKEAHRKSMILWGEQMREEDPFYFSKKATDSLKAPAWIVVDARRPIDIQYFQKNFPGKIVLVRIKACEEVRKSRGWIFTAGVDDQDSECALDYLDDAHNCNVIVNNNDCSDETLETQLRLALDRFNEKLCT